MRYIEYYDSPIGQILFTSDADKALTGLWFEGGRFFNDVLSVPFEERSLPVFDETAKWLDIYFSGRQPGFIPSIKFPEASDFRIAVWKALLQIPYGKTVTYGDIASMLSSGSWTGSGTAKVSARAVGGAVGHNPIGIIVPCHRVVGAGGSLTGYAGGLERKAALLELEGVK